MILRMVMPIVILGVLALFIEMVVARRRHPAVRGRVTLALLALAALPVAIVLHNVISAFTGGDEAVSFFVALLTPLLVAITTVAVAVRLHREPGASALGFGVAGAGLGLLAAFILLSLVLSELGGGGPPRQRWLDPLAAVVVPLGTLAVVAGTAYEAFALVFRSSARSTP